MGQAKGRIELQHRVSFDEAVTVFYDPLAASLTIRVIRRKRIGWSPSANRAKVEYSSSAMLNEVKPYASSARVVQRLARKNVMTAKRRVRSDGMRREYKFDYSTAVRGKYYRRLLKEGANVVVLEPDVAMAFRSSAAVNEALRSLLSVSEAMRRLTSRSSRRTVGARG